MLPFHTKVWDPYLHYSNHQYSSDLLQGGLQIPCKLVFESHDVEFMAKVRKHLQSAPPIYVQLEQPASKRKLESLYKAKAEPVKKKERKDDSQAIDLNNNDVSQSTVAVARDAAKEIPWVKPPCRRFVYRNNLSCCKMLGCMHV